MVEEQKYDVENIKDLPVNPIIEKLVAVSPEEPVVEMVGFASPSKNDTVRLYRDFSLTEYFEIPKNAILHFTSDPKDKDNRLSVFVKASTEVNIVSMKHSRSRAGDLESSDSPSVAHRIPLPPELISVINGMEMFYPVPDACSLTRQQINSLTIALANPLLSYNKRKDYESALKAAYLTLRNCS